MNVGNGGDRAGTKAGATGPAAVATATEDVLPRRFADFETLGDALDYAARGHRGLNFHDARGNLSRAYSFAELRADALVMARRLVAAGIAPAAHHRPRPQTAVPRARPCRAPHSPNRD